MTEATTNADSRPGLENAPTSPDPTTTASQSPWSTTRLIKAGAATGLVVVIAGGYAGSWKWTGFTANSSLWDWLNLLLLPVAFATLPLFLREHTSVGRTRRLALAVGVGLLAILVALGYGFGWTWTGFPGNTVWDWLQLLVLPAVIVAWPVIKERVDRLGPRSAAALSLTGAAFAILVIGGYADHWTWTGFAGNTLWDWLRLLLLPVVLPWWVLPSMTRWMKIEIEANKRAAPPPPSIPSRGAGRAGGPKATDRAHVDQGVIGDHRDSDVHQNQK